MSFEPVAQLFVSALHAAGRAAPTRVLYLNAEPIGAKLFTDASELRAVQPWRPSFLALAQSGLRPVASVAGDDARFDLVLLRLGRQRQRNLATVASAVERCDGGGMIIVAGDNALGSASYARRIDHLGSLSKNHARAFWFDRTRLPAPALLAEWSRAGALHMPAGGDFVAAPGLFAWDRVDAGSRLLAQALPAGVTGDIADLGAGWGFLAREILRRGARPHRLDLYEADWLALEAARRNLADLTGATGPTFHWHDVTAGLDAARYDLIVMNPPFHDHMRADPTIGIAFIRVAAKALRPGGRLLLVANRHLPYEQALAACFASITRRAEDAQFKVIEATR